MNLEVPEQYDIAIIGAGPAGSTCALALKHAGRKIILLDRDRFPRDKVCGDAIPARCHHVLHALDPNYAEQLAQFTQRVDIRGCRVVAPNRVHFDYYFQTGGYCIERMVFDQFLLDLALKESQPTYREGFRVTEVRREHSGWRIISDQGAELHSKVVVGCDGAQSVVARHLTDRQMDPKHHCAAVRAYYHGITGLETDKMEIHFLEDWLPGYFWIFPLAGGWANVGFGMLSQQISERKLPLRQGLEAIVSTAPGLRERFASSTRRGPVRGFGLPLGSRKVAMSGEGFLLCGDAAALVEPATGEGIGNAMLSGQLAAQHLERAFQTGDFSAQTLAAYDQELYGKIWKDLRRKYLAQKYLGERKKLMNWLVNRAARPGPIRWMMRKVF